MSPAALHVALLAGGGAAILVVAAALLMGREAGQRDLQERIRALNAAPTPGRAAAAPRAAHVLLSILRRFGESLRRTALFSESDLQSLERATAAAGFNPRNTVSIFIGIKMVVLVAAPVLAWVTAGLLGASLAQKTMAVAGGAMLGVLGPGWFVNALRGPYVKAMKKGLPDALDLMVVCAEAGLGLESAVERVAQEMGHSSRPVGMEFALLGQELRMLPDRREALARMGERTGIEGFRRLSSTLSQTLRYGTPLAQALRILAAEMRQERMAQMEERASRLPALLVLPLILFILPCLFIVLIGPSVIRVMSYFGGP
jgi:tight adherence protein C